MEESNTADSVKSWASVRYPCVHFAVSFCILLWQSRVALLCHKLSACQGHSALVLLPHTFLASQGRETDNNADPPTGRTVGLLNQSVQFSCCPLLFLLPAAKFIVKFVGL